MKKNSKKKAKTKTHHDWAKKANDKPEKIFATYIKDKWLAALVYKKATKIRGEKLQQFNRKIG